MARSAARIPAQLAARAAVRPAAARWIPEPWAAAGEAQTELRQQAMATSREAARPKAAGRLAPRSRAAAWDPPARPTPMALTLTAR